MSRRFQFLNSAEDFITKWFCGRFFIRLKVNEVVMETEIYCWVVLIHFHLIIFFLFPFTESSTGWGNAKNVSTIVWAENYHKQRKSFVNPSTNSVIRFKSIEIQDFRPEKFHDRSQLPSSIGRLEVFISSKPPQGCWRQNGSGCGIVLCKVHSLPLQLHFLCESSAISFASLQLTICFADSRLTRAWAWPVASARQKFHDLTDEERQQRTCWGELSFFLPEISQIK